MKYLYIFTLAFLFLVCSSYAAERTEKEIKLGVFLEDLKDIGKFERILESPQGLFPEHLKGFHPKASKAQEEIGLIFVKQKGLLEKYPARMMLGMAYFEFFYMKQLQDNKKTIERFEINYPKVSTKITMQKIYSLNKARKTMREAVGLSLNDDVQKALLTYYTMHKLFKQSNTTVIKLTKEEKKIRKLHQGIAKQVGKAKSLAEAKKEQRIPDKKFKKDYSKIHKDLSKALKKTEHIKEYELFSSFIVEVNKLKDKPSSLKSGYKLAEFILSDLKKNNLSKKFEHDLSKAKFDSFTQDELKTLGDITKATKLNKNKKSNEIQADILNLENGGMPVNKLLDVYRDELDVKLDSLNLQLASATTMSRWALSDWANAWKNPIPTKVQKAGIEVSLTAEEIESIKAQLAMQNFKEIIEIDLFKDLIDNNSELDNLQAAISESTKSFEFSFTLDDFAQALGDIRGLDINNYADLTALANAQHSANWSVEEYTSVYEGHLQVIHELQSGNINSFQAGKIAESFSSSLQEVADTIAAASAAGVSVDLEAVAAGAGYDSFAAAVAAYNAEHGTSYTVDSAREALGQ